MGNSKKRGKQRIEASSKQDKKAKSSNRGKRKEQQKRSYGFCSHPF